MTVSPLTLSNMAAMESALYGGIGMNPNSSAPNYLNGYTGDIYNLSNYPYGYFNYPYYDNMYNANSAFTPAAQSQAQTEISESDVNTLANYYKNTNGVNSETFLNASTAGALMFAAMENPQTFAHLWNSKNAVSQTDKVFKEILKSNENTASLWKAEAKAMQSAYSQLYRVNRNAQSKWFTSKWFIDPAKFSADRETLEKIMKEALESGDINQIKTATEKLRVASGINGRIPQACAWVKNKLGFGDGKVLSPLERINADIAKGAEGSTILKAAAEKAPGLIKSCAKESGVWVAFEVLMDLGKINTAFSKDTSTGFKQLGQTAVKGACSAIGFTAGRALGAWGGAKLGAVIGSAICPGAGTAIGAALGFVGASVGMWAMGKLAKKITGPDAASEVEAEKMAKSQDGQIQLLQYTIEKAQNGELKDENTIAAAERILDMCA